MRKTAHWAAASVVAIAAAAGIIAAASAQSGDEVTSALATARERANALDRRLTSIEDLNAIENLQRTYGFFVDKGLWREAADLFAEDATLEIGGRGVFAGKARIYQYFNFLGAEGPQYGRLLDHMQLQPIVHVAPDGLTARARLRFLAQVGELDPKQGPGTPESRSYSGKNTGVLGMGVYENEYVKENGVWKIKTLHAFFRMYTRDTEGWGKTAFPITRPEKDLPPDRPPTVVHDQYPATYSPPFHYKNPVTGG